MVKAKGDRETMDLLTWEPQDGVKRFDDERVRAASLRAKIARAVSETLRDASLDDNSVGSREKIAERMSVYLGEKVSKAMLDAYASGSRADHNISFERLIALVHATADIRLLQLAAEQFQHSVIDDRYLEWVRLGQLADKKDELDKEFESVRRAARRSAKK